jgi:hypothetical protein
MYSAYEVVQDVVVVNASPIIRLASSVSTYRPAYWCVQARWGGPLTNSIR